MQFQHSEIDTSDLWLVIILEYFYLNEATLEEDENQAKKNESLIP